MPNEKIVRLPRDYIPGDLVRWMWDPPTLSPPGLVLKVSYINNIQMAEVWWAASKITTILPIEDIELIASSPIEST